MRSDMAKIIVERPRHDHAGARWRPGRTRALTDDDGAPIAAVAREPARQRPIKTKDLNENLAPLRRYLERQIGRPWNKVQGEIAAHLAPASTVQQHVRDHVEDFVATRTRMQDGVVMASAHRFGGERALDVDYREFYVHPRTGLLRRNPHAGRWSARERDRKAAEAAERATRLREIDAKTQLHRLKDGVWWEVKLAKMGDGLDHDVLYAAGLSDLPSITLYGRDGVRAIAKRILSKAEKKRFGLD